MKKLWAKILALLGKKSKQFLENQKYVAKDESYLILPDLIIKLNRYTNLDVPHEVTMVVPRVELRKTQKMADGSTLTYESLLNSVTVVSAPRHPLAGEAQQPPQIPPKIDEPGKQQTDQRKKKSWKI